MKNAYLAVCYICNQNCSFCPCSRQEKKANMVTPIEELMDSIDEFIVDGVTDLTISGGEPTLHPHITELISYIQKKNINVTILTNGERFANKTYFDSFIDVVDVNKVRFITTIHSEKAVAHEEANRTLGSFDKSVSGLKRLSDFGAKVIVKHCVTKENYKDLTTFFKYFDDIFRDSVDIQLCSIDYCGMPKSRLDKEMLTFTMLKPYLEELFDYHISLKAKKRVIRNLYCINMPLCSCDVYYWSYIPKRKSKMYDLYKDPHSKRKSEGVDIVATDEKICSKCKAYKICCGTYITAFKYFGNKIVTPYI